MTFSEQLYRLLLALYPASHRREYGEWMAQAFRDQCRAARQEGLWGWLALWRRTLTDAAVTIVIEHLESGKKVAMRNLFAKTNEPGTWLEAFAAAVPFIIYGALGILYALNANGFMPYPGPLGLSYNVWIVMIGNVVTAVVLAIGWIQGFPRWSYTALLPLWFYYNYLSNMWSGTRPPIDGIRVWLPVVIVLGYPLYRTRSLRPLWAFISGIWRDWSRLSFLLYGLMAVLIPLIGDETHGMARIFHTIVAVLFMTAGAVAYIRAESTGQRILALFGGMVASSISLFLFITPYWNGRYEPWMQNPQPLLDTFGLVMQVVNFLIGAALILFSPVLIPGVKQVSHRLNLFD